MAKLVVSNGYYRQVQNYGLMPSPDFTAWDYGSIDPDGSVVLSPGGQNSISLIKITLTGTDLAISPDFTTTSGPDIITREVSGIVESFSYFKGTIASYSEVSAKYVITGLSISFEDLLIAGVDPLTILLSGDDEIIGSDSYDTLKGYDGNDVFLPGLSGRYPSNTYYDQIDGGNGIDTISYADMYQINVFINLTDGTARLGSADAPTSARMVSIENAIGSARNDTITGDANANDLTGGEGNDRIYGLNGHDRLFGGDGSDVLYGGDGNDVLDVGSQRVNDKDRGSEFVDGGAGIDTITFSAPSHVGYLQVNLETGTFSGVAGTGHYLIYGTVVNVEDVVGGPSYDNIIGSSLANRLYGGDGKDKIYGGIGNDILRGDAGEDVLDGGAGTDRADFTTSTIGVTVNLANGTSSENDQLISIENLYGSKYNDVLIGSVLANKLYGYNGNDQLFGLNGNDRLEGQAGDDALFGGEGNDFQIGGAGNDGLFDEAGHDKLYGGEGNDYLAGGDGNDTIVGEAGDDQIDAGAGNDRVIVGAGNDGITLGAGDDVVVYGFGNGQDTIFDFGNGHDIIDFSATNATLLGLQAIAIETAAGVLFQDGADSMLLSGLTVNQLDWNGDFVFAA